MILELDAGNSRIKWRLLDTGGGLLSRGAVGDATALREEAAAAKPGFIRVCSVRSRAENEEIGRIAMELDARCKFAQVTQSFGPVRNQYADVSRLGVDRWLAMVAAYQRSGSACMIVDAGTALTVDVLNDDGLHLGGYILPGLELMRSSLEQHTAIRLGDLQQGLSLAPGNSTNEAVGNGVNAAVVGAIRQALARLSGENDTVKLYVSGGDAPVLRPLLAAVPGLHVEEVQDLVFEGLALICPMD